jgi:hypothetical protein
VWEGPDFLSTKYTLASGQIYYRSKKLRHLFSDIVEIRDADFFDFLHELESIKDKGLTDVTKISNIYREISDTVGKYSDVVR